MFVFIHRLTHSVTAVYISICYANINIFMHSISDGLHGILAKLNALQLLRCAPPDPLLQRFNTEDSPFLSETQICP